MLEVHSTDYFEAHALATSTRDCAIALMLGMGPVMRSDFKLLWLPVFLHIFVDRFITTYFGGTMIYDDASCIASTTVTMKSHSYRKIYFGTNRSRLALSQQGVVGSSARELCSVVKRLRICLKKVWIEPANLWHRLLVSMVGCKVRFKLLKHYPHTQWWGGEAHLWITLSDAAGPSC